MSKTNLIVAWVLVNLIGVAFLAFPFGWLLRIIGWLWVTAALSFGGLVSLGGLSLPWPFSKPQSS